MKTSDSSISWYFGRPFSVFLVIKGSARLQPKPNGPLPAPESYDRASCGPKPERPGLVAIGTVMDPVPVTGLAANCSPMPRIAPPPLGREIVGAESCALSCASPFCSPARFVPLTTGSPLPIGSCREAQVFYLRSFNIWHTKPQV